MFNKTSTSWKDSKGCKAAAVFQDGIDWFQSSLGWFDDEPRMLTTRDSVIQLTLWLPSGYN